MSRCSVSLVRCSTVFVASSMPIRDVETFFPERERPIHFSEFPVAAVLS
jgi:2-succinyl-5-enolpyruvyl-6-hydroxy-3-cyclohexene-1-carboxylate synthase